MTSSTSTSLSSFPSETPHKPIPRIPKWVPVVMFAGTSIALVFPLILLARRRKTVFYSSLGKTPSPPRRTGTRINLPPARVADTKAHDDTRSPGIGELMGVISRVDFSTALYVGKAFGIATLLVASVGTAGVLGVKGLVGVHDTREFAHEMRMAVWAHLPWLTAHIHRPVEEKDMLDEAEGVILENSVEDG